MISYNVIFQAHKMSIFKNKEETWDFKATVGSYWNFVGDPLQHGWNSTRLSPYFQPFLVTYHSEATGSSNNVLCTKRSIVRVFILKVRNIEELVKWSHMQVKLMKLHSHEMFLLRKVMNKCFQKLLSAYIVHRFTYIFC